MSEVTRNASEVVGRNVRELRKGRGWSVRRLVEECRAVGFEVTSNVIENIEGLNRRHPESGDVRAHRGVTVDELIALASVFKVTLADLLKASEGPRIGSAAEVSDAVAERVKDLRKRGGYFTQAAFAAHCAEIGADHLTANVLYVIENGRRKDGRRRRTISVDELHALAVALQVHPTDLLPAEWRTR